jgi:hypothetical protein
LSLSAQIESEDLSLELYPNPAPKGELKLQTDIGSTQDQPLVISVRDIIGNHKLYRVITSGNTINQSLDPEGILTSGIYVVTVSSGNISKSARVIVK